MLNIFILLVCLIAAGLLMVPRLARNQNWRAAITPLASIIGSGFLLLGPVLNSAYGAMAPFVMAGLCIGAYAFGAAIRFNIARLAQTARHRSPLEERLETLSAWALAFAYVISVAYYLNLLGAFAVSMTGLDGPAPAKLVTTAVFLVILAVGWTRGFTALERLEQVSVGLKLSIIAGLLAGLAWYFAQQASVGMLGATPASLTGWPAVTLAAGLLVTVQGFETSRYLGAEYSPQMRIRSMKLAQGLSALIYMVYIVLLSFAFAPDTTALTETAIIDMMAIVAPVLPLLLVAAAISAQFSAAVADTGGSGGLMAELTGGRISVRTGYGLLVFAGVGLTWSVSIFDIMSYASRAFAFYYALQSFIAAKGAACTPGRRKQAALFTLLGIAGCAIALLGSSVE